MKELSNEARALIHEVGASDGPRAADRARVKQRLVTAIASAGTVLSGGSLAIASAPVAASAAKVTAGSVALWLAVGAGLGAAVSTPTAVSAYRRSVEARTPSVVVASRSPALRTRERRSEMSSHVEEATPAEKIVETSKHEDAPAESNAPHAALRSHEARPSDVPVAASSLAEETRLLHAAQRELAQKHAPRALELLDEHALRFPQGALAQERSAARVLALCDLGRSAEARRLAEAFVSSSPRSPLVPRLRGSCALSDARADDASQ